MWQEFQKFIMRGSVVDLAVGIIIGSAFTGIVNSLVNDILMPPIGLLIGGVDFSAIVITLKQATETDPAVTMNIGVFINQVIQFLIVAFAVFLLVRVLNRVNDRFEKPKKETADPAPAPEEQLISAIEELTATLKAQSGKHDG